MMMYHIYTYIKTYINQPHRPTFVGTELALCVLPARTRGVACVCVVCACAHSVRVSGVVCACWRMHDDVCVYECNECVLLCMCMCGVCVCVVCVCMCGVRVCVRMCVRMMNEGTRNRSSDRHIVLQKQDQK